MKGFIQVRADVAGYGDHVQVLVNPRSIELVVRTSWGCEIQLPSSILQVTDAYEDVIAQIEAAETEGNRKPADRPLMWTWDWMDMDLPGESAPTQRRAQWEADRDGWPYCTNCGVPADIDREEFRMKGNIRAAKTPRCPTCGAVMDGKDTDVPTIPPDMAETQAFLEEAFGVKLHATPHSAPDVDLERKLAFRSGEEEPGESSSIAAPAAMRSIPPSSDDGGGDAL